MGAVPPDEVEAEHVVEVRRRHGEGWKQIVVHLHAAGDVGVVDRHLEIVGSPALDDLGLER